MRFMHFSNEEITFAPLTGQRPAAILDFRKPGRTKAFEAPKGALDAFFVFKGCFLG